MSQVLLEPAEGRREQRFCLSPLCNKFQGKGKMATGLFLSISQNKSDEVELITAVVSVAIDAMANQQWQMKLRGRQRLEGFPHPLSLLRAAFLLLFSCSIPVQPSNPPATPCSQLSHEQGGCSIKPLQWWPNFPVGERPHPSIPCGTWHPSPWHSFCQPCPTLWESREYLHWKMLSWCCPSCPWR